MLNFKSKSIMLPLLGLVLIATLGTILSVGTAVYFLNKSKMDDKIALVRSQVESVRSLVGTFAAKVQKGELDEKTAQEMARNAVRDMRYGENNNEYFFVYDGNGMTIVLGPKPELEGHMRIDVVDSNGFQFVRKMIEDGKKGGAPVFYYYPKNGSDVPVRKVSYSAYYQPWNWVIGTGLYVDDIETEVAGVVKHLSVIVALVILVVLTIATVMARSIANPVKALAQTTKAIGGGDYTVDVPATDRADEVGALAKAIEVLRDEAQEAEQLRREQEAVKARFETQKHEEMLMLADNFQSSVMGAVKSIVDAVHDNDTAAKSLSNLAGKAGSEAKQVTATVDEANRNVQVIASAAEELLASIREISGQVQNANGVATQAVAKAAETDHLVQGLNDAVARITDVVGLISNVASQTNLLALNATIEAARAGEAGKGFAVVAGEVKSLATQTAKATDEIVTQIEAVKNATHLAITAIKEISATIASVSEVSTSIAAAVEEQSAATNEIARNVTKAAQGVDAVSGFVGRLAGITTEVKDGVETVSEVTASLNGQSGILQNEVEKFVARIRS